MGGSGGAGKPLKVLEWNCHNFFNDKNDSAAPDETVVTTSAYQQHLTDVASVIGMIDPDVAVLTEIENQAVLDDLNTKLGNKYAERSLIDGNDPRGVDIASLSKISYSSVISHAADSFVLQGTQGPSYTFARDAVEYHFTFNGKPVVLIGVHFRSKGPPDDPNKRLAEAEKARSIADSITAKDPTTGIVVLGDYNDLPTSDPVKAVTGKAPDIYTDAASFVAAADQWSFNFMGTSKELIDHQMANPVATAWLDDASVTIVHSATVDDASDHSPVIATYLVK